LRRETFEQILRRFNSAEPFEPFTVELVNGIRLISRHPEAIILVGDLAVYVEPDRTEQYFDASSVARIIDLIVPPGAE
jgi:hypothetical protein